MREAAVGAGHLREAVNEIAATKRGDAGRLRIGLMTSLASGFLSELFDAYHRRFTDVEVKFEEKTAQANAAGVLHRRLDAALIPGDPRLPTSDASMGGEECAGTGRSWCRSYP